MRTTLARRASILGVVIGLAALTACADDEPAAKDDGTGPVSVKASDSGCELSRRDVKSGTSTFSVTNGGSKVTEFYVYADGDRVMGEVENIGPGLKRELIVELPTGKYQAVCKPGMVGDGIRGDLNVTGDAPAQIDTDTALKQATESYQRYVNSQAVALEQKTTEFVTAVKAGDVAKAKELFPVSRTYWERIEPVAESFGDLDPKIDARINDVEPGTEWTGYHRIEQALWVSNSTKGMEKYADLLLTDVKTVVAKAKVVKLTPLQLANGAKELLDEVATGKVTGEEDRYSHTDLWDFEANVEGSQAAIQALRPALQKRDPALVTQLDTNFKTVFAALDKYRDGDGFKPYTATEAEKKALGAVVDGLAEPVSKVAGVLAKK
ncbi:iron uptake system protein EfeO [Kribbella speibonae]|uniref:Iron uptake system protein EfeO n=1 Tax=Kribbella speibonae TaxID=1572660 RepID=A0A4R0J8R6_9ACTN|nr:iron uptake system protein EfeO [Kribbella speibonae]TCC20427.1 iron uptake system protein EfeO [Kribbella speibonae]TCC41704.1 iron uptake system protein EfeO [Kribbella speibonae]